MITRLKIAVRRLLLRRRSSRLSPRNVSPEKQNQNISSESTSELFAVADFCLIPMGTGHDPSVAVYIAECARILQRSGLKYQVRTLHCLSIEMLDRRRRHHQMHGYGTNLEGSWSAVSKAIHDCHAAVHAMGAPRIATDIRIGTRYQPRSDAVPGEGENERKLRRVEDILSQDRVTAA
ncbi:YkoF-like protein [Russula brevipes]|nr:YkoF-like protein [Russula brevipes]